MPFGTPEGPRARALPVAESARAQRVHRSIKSRERASPKILLGTANGTRCLFDFRPHPYSDASENQRTLPRAKNCSPALNFCTSARTGAALSSPSRRSGEINKGIPLVGIPLFIWYAGRDSNPQPSEPESDALSIEPPAHLLESLYIIPSFYLFVKGNFVFSNSDRISQCKNSCFPPKSVL